MRSLSSLKSGAAILCLVLCLALPSSVSGQVAAAQIQVSDADAMQQIPLAPPTDWLAALPSLAPWINVVGADGIGYAPLLGISASREPKNESSGSDSIHDRPLSSTIPTAGIQVANADGIGRFDLRPMGSLQAMISAGDSTGSEEGVVSGTFGPSASVASIQVTGADAVGRLALSPIAEPSAKAHSSATPTAAVDTPTNESKGIRQAVVIADGKLNVRSGPGQNFDIIGQLDMGMQVTVLKTSDDSQWLLIMDPSGLTGWVNARFVELVR